MVKNDLTTYGVGIGLLNPEALIPRTGGGAAIDGGAAAVGGAAARHKLNLAAAARRADHLYAFKQEWDAWVQLDRASRVGRDDDARLVARSRNSVPYRDAPGSLPAVRVYAGHIYRT